MTSNKNENDADYVAMRSDASPPFTPQEMAHLRTLLAVYPLQNPNSVSHDPSSDPIAITLSTDSDYPQFHDSTHAWAVFADDPRKSASWQDRMVGLFIIFFQLYAYYLFASEAIKDYQSGQVPVMVGHNECQETGYTPDADSNLQCEANYTNNRDAFVAFFMLGIFLSGDMIQAIRVLWDAHGGLANLFGLLAFLEVAGAFSAACLSISYHLYIGEVTDAIEVGVGLLFIRELSSKTYSGIRNGKKRQYYEYISCLFVLVIIGMCVDPFCERWLA
eukprot:scaffold162_cov176-Amphora_coffeaeformis.AAC.45